MYFSIGLPVVKSHFLESSIMSIVKQNFDDFEVIIQNNSSDPSEKEKIRQIASKYTTSSKFSYCENEVSLPMTENFNSILAKCAGDYFTILSDDDVMDPDFLRTFHELSLKYPDTYVFHCRVKIINEKNDLLDITPICPEFETQADFLFNRLINCRIQFLSDFVVKTKEFKEVGGFEYFNHGWGLDDLAWTRMATNGIGYTPKTLLLYRKHTGNVTSSIKNLEKRFDDINFLFDEYDKIVKQQSFIKGSVYPADYLEKALKKKKDNSIRFVFMENLSKQSVWTMVKFYKKYKKNYAFKLKHLGFGMVKKVSTTLNIT